jgi:hypothetical protein
MALDQQFCSSTTPRQDNVDISSSQPQVRKNIALATHFGLHQDVMVALAWTIERVMKNNGTLSIYAPWPPPFGLEDIVNDLGLFHGVVKQDPELMRDILSDPGPGGIDMIIFGTCEVECVVIYRSCLGS